MASRYNKLSRPIAVLGSRAAYMHLCEHCKLAPSDNDVFHHVHDYYSAMVKREYLRVLEIDGAEDTRDYHAIVSLAQQRIRNEATASKSTRPESGN